MAIPLVLAAALSILDYLTENIFGRKRKIATNFISIASGVSVAYLFLSLLPKLYVIPYESGGQMVFIFVALGFVSHHLIEKFTFEHVPKRKIKRDISLEHAIVVFIYHMIIGLALVDLFNQNTIEGLLFFFPVALYIILDNLPRKSIFQTKFVRGFFASSAFLGALIGFYTQLPTQILFILLGFVVGALLYFILREELPSGSQGSITAFLIGLIAYSTLIITLWFI